MRHLLDALRACGFADQITEVVSGGARGVDLLGEEWARRSWKIVLVKRFLPDWRPLPPPAPPDRLAAKKRNELMAAYADALVAVWDEKSGGTADMIRRATKHGLRVYVHKVTR